MEDSPYLFARDLTELNAGMSGRSVRSGIWPLTNFADLHSCTQPFNSFLETAAHASIVLTAKACSARSAPKALLASTRSPPTVRAAPRQSAKQMSVLPTVEEGAAAAVAAVAVQTSAQSLEASSAELPSLPWSAILSGDSLSSRRGPHKATTCPKGSFTKMARRTTHRA